MLEGRPLHPHADVLGARGLQLSPRLRHFRPGAQSAIEAALSQVEGFLIGHQGLVQKLLLRIEAAELEIVDGELGMQAQANGFQIGGAGLGLFAGGCDGAADTAPGVQLVVDVDRQRVLAEVAGVRAQRRVLRETVGGDGGRSRNGGEETGPRQLNQRARLAKAGFRGLEGLVGGVDLLFQPVEFRAAEELPPVHADRGVGGLRLLPPLRFRERLRRLLAECGCGRDRRLGVFRADHAACEQQRISSEECRRAHHLSDALASRTSVPEVSESEGFSIISSCGVMPESTSTSVP